MTPRQAQILAAILEGYAVGLKKIDESTYCGDFDAGYLSLLKLAYEHNRPDYGLGH